MDLLQFREMFTAAVPAWGAMQVAFSAKYLGVYVGPDKGIRSWQSPFAKFLSRAQQWGALGLGLHMTIRAYATHMASVLFFVCQLEATPTTSMTLRLEHAADFL